MCLSDCHNLKEIYLIQSQHTLTITFFSYRRKGEFMINQENKEFDFK